MDVASRLIVGERVSQAPNDTQELVPTCAAIPSAVDPVSAVLVDNGFYSEAAVQRTEQTADGGTTGTTAYAALDKTTHHRSVADLEKNSDPPAPPTGASVSDVMRQRLQSAAGRALYRWRQQTIEPVREHQIGPRLPPIPPPRHNQGVHRADPGLPGVQSQTTVSPQGRSQTRSRGVKSPICAVS